MIFLYDKIIGDYLQLKDFNLIIATGLTQEINETAEYYYRLNLHKNFLKKFPDANLIDANLKKEEEN